MDMHLHDIPTDRLLAELARRLDATPVEPAPARLLDLVSLGQLVADVWSIDPTALAGHARTRRIASARQQFCMAARTYTGETLETIAAVIRRDHSTVCHAVSRHPKLLESDIDYQRGWDLITGRLSHACRRSSRQANSRPGTLPAA